jgi:hypothetical protein
MYQLPAPPPEHLQLPPGWNILPPLVAPLTNAELEQLESIVINQYRNMTPNQKRNMNGNWNTAVNGYPQMRISGRPSGDGGLSKNIEIRRQIGNNRFSPSIVLFNTADLAQPELPPYQEAQGGRKSRSRKSRRRKSRRLRKSRKTRKSRRLSRR